MYRLEMISWEFLGLNFLLVSKYRGLEIWFGFICYNVRAGFMLRDLFPDPEIVCKILNKEQLSAGSWNGS